MSMISCPECKGSMSDFAEFCPHCGFTTKHHNENGRKTKRKRSFLSWLGIAFVALFAISIVSAAFDIAQGKKPGKQHLSKSTSSPKSSVKPIQISAIQLSREYEKNEVSADMRYKNRWVAVDGRVHNVGKDILNHMYVTLKKGGQFNIIGVVQCYFHKIHQNDIARLRKGLHIKVLGKVSGKLGNIHIRQCRVIR